MTAVLEVIQNFRSYGRWACIMFGFFFGIAFSYQPPPLAVTRYVASAATLIPPQYAQPARAVEWSILCFAAFALSIFVLRQAWAFTCYLAKIPFKRAYSPFILGLPYLILGLASLTLSITD
jgi:hypothetical protein